MLVKIVAAVRHVVYAAPFVGTGGVFFRRTRVPRGEVINDRNGEVANIFRIPSAALPAVHGNPETPDHQPAGIRTSQTLRFRHFDRPRTRGSLHLSAEFRLRWKGRGQNFGVDTTGRARFNLTSQALLLEDVHERLSGVVIENLELYLDPPYFGSEGDYGKTLFVREQFEVISEPSVASKATPFCPATPFRRAELTCRDVSGCGHSRAKG